MKRDFLSPKLEGQRFEGHTVPLELIKDFSALQEMLIDVAKWEFMKAHPDRVRIPRNFASALELHLEGIDEGSAILKIVLLYISLFPPHLTYFEAAKTDIIAAIASAEQSRTPDLPSKFLTYFDRFGRGLRAGESMSFSLADGSKATLNPETREKLIRSADVAEWTEEVALRGRIPEGDHRKNSFQMELSDGTILTGDLSGPYRDVISKAWLSYNKGHDEYVLIRGIAKKDRQGQFKAFEAIEDVTALDPLDVALRLDSLAQLQDGWLDGIGTAPDKEGLKRLAAAFDTHFDPELPLPYLYPTPEGGIQAEWSLNENTWSITLEVAPEGMEAEYQALNLTTHESLDQTISLSTENGWAALNKALRQLISPSSEEITVDV
ncbi:MAG: hypothetical protein M3O31_16070 [Acidobacteriota bacterium]|nr:hypothetical protein [Acidobacteriota bacterium]